MAAQILSDGSPEGTSMAGAVTDLLSIYGGTPIAQPASANQAAVTSTGVASAGAWACAQLASLKSHVDDINTLLTAVRAAAVPTTGIGMMKGAA